MILALDAADAPNMMAGQIFTFKYFQECRTEMNSDT